MCMMFSETSPKEKPKKTASVIDTKKPTKKDVATPTKPKPTTKTKNIDTKKLKSKRLEILEKSLEKKNKEVDRRIKNHWEFVKLANGQPLNDKGAFGRRVLKKWDDQFNSIGNQFENIEKTKRAIEREKDRIKKQQYQAEYIAELETKEKN